MRHSIFAEPMQLVYTDAEFLQNRFKQDGSQCYVMISFVSVVRLCNNKASYLKNLLVSSLKLLITMPLQLNFFPAYK